MNKEIIDLRDEAAVYLEQNNINGDTMVAMNCNLEDIPESLQGSFNLFDLLSEFANKAIAGYEHKEKESGIAVRPVVKWFAEQMELKLKDNDHKTGWVLDSGESLLKRLKEETKELSELFGWRKANTGRSASEGLSVTDTSNEAIIREAADIANFAMMIADIYGKQFDAVHTTSQPSPPDTGLREALEKIVNMSEDNGRAGCTWGDTEYDSLSVAFGYNLCVSNVKDIATEALNPTANVHDTPNKEK